MAIEHHACLHSPSKWPESVTPIPARGLALFGVDDRGALYWDGRRVMLVSDGRPRRWPRTIAVLAGILAAVGGFLSGCAALLRALA
jgi:hypothetical protein